MFVARTPAAPPEGSRRLPGLPRPRKDKLSHFQNNLHYVLYCTYRLSYVIDEPIHIYDND